MRFFTIAGTLAASLATTATALQTHSLSEPIRADSAAVTASATLSGINGTETSTTSSGSSSMITTTSASASGTSSGSGTGAATATATASSSSPSPGDPGNASQTGVSNAQNAASRLGLEDKMMEVVIAGVGVVAGILL
ncbi:hypothetical protein H2203_001341 [Taxawa tesnikishii (nom. ined.)]|nr:hypothetical protein H2203_001341 [Dothideales sp. JES 119]